MSAFVESLNNQFRQFGLWEKIVIPDYVLGQKPGRRCSEGCNKKMEIIEIWKNSDGKRAYLLKCPSCNHQEVFS